MQPIAEEAEGIRQKTLSRIIVPVLLIFLVSLISTVMLHSYLANPDALWQDVQHDRNSHLAFALDLTQHMRDGNALGWLERVTQSTIWPPLHGVLLSLVLWATGEGHRLAILPSLVGWTGTVVLCGVLAQRLAGRNRVAGLLAGAVAIAFAVMSPAFRLLGTDVMLEGLGAALSAAVLLTWLHCAAAPAGEGRWRLLGLLLTLLFLEKYNYWSLVVAALLLSAAPGRAGMWLHWARIAVRTARPARMARDPLLLAAATLLIAVVIVTVRGPTDLTVMGRNISLHPPGNVLSLAYGLMLLRLALWWRKNRILLLPVLGPAGAALLRWHVLPAAIWLLVPFVLQDLLWFLGGNFRPGVAYRPWDNALLQVAGFGWGFHVAPWAAMLAAALAGIGLARIWSAKDIPGAEAVAVFLPLCALAVVLHPQQQWRFQATWLFALWAFAGVGAAALRAWLPGGFGRWWAVLPLAGLLLLAELAQPLSPMAERVAIRRSSVASDLLLLDAYRQFVVDGEPVGFVSTLGKNDFFHWSVREACRCAAFVSQPYTFADPSREAVAATTAAWIATTPARRLVAIQAERRSDNAPVGLIGRQQYGQLDALAAQGRFRRVSTVSVPSYPAELSFWEDTTGAPPAPARRYLVAAGMSLIAVAVLVALW